MERDNFVTAEKVRNAFQGLEYRKHTLITLYDDFLTDYAQKVKCGLKSKRTLQKYHAVYKHLKSFLQTRHHLSDIALKEIQPTFATDFETFLLTYCHLSHNTVWLYSFPVRMLMHRAVENGWLVRYPFSDYNISQAKTRAGVPGKGRNQTAHRCPQTHTRTNLHSRYVSLLHFYGTCLYRFEEPS